MHDIPDETGTRAQVRLNGAIFELVEDWRRRQPKILSRSEAIRQLLEQALDQAQRHDPAT